MFKSLKNIFDQSKSSSEVNQYTNLDLLSGLMIEAAQIDGEIHEKEYENILTSLTTVFKENRDEANLSLNKAIEENNNNKSLYFYTSKLNKEYSLEKKILLIQTLWEIVLSDGEIHDYESSLVRRLSGLLYVSDIDSGNAKKRALDKISK